MSLLAPGYALREQAPIHQQKQQPTTLRKMKLQNY
jgi:hypothetical protein